MDDKFIIDDDSDILESFWSEYPKRGKEFVRVYPCLTNDLNSDTVIGKKDGSFYIHVPFCNNVCVSCIYNKYNTRTDLVKRYVQALKEEIMLYGQNPDIKNLKFTSGYIGGGTPTTLTANQLDEVLGCLYENVDVAEDAFCTIETTPVDIDEEKLKILLKYGFSRVSLGVQSLNADMLKNIGRNYAPDVAVRAMKMIKDSGVKYLAIDLMYGKPGETLEKWCDTLDKIIELNLADSISIYEYMVMPSSQLNMHLERKSSPDLPKHREKDEMYWTAVNKFHDAGYLSVSNVDFLKEDTCAGMNEKETARFALKKDDRMGIICKTCESTKQIASNWYFQESVMALGNSSYGFLNDYVYFNEPDINEYMEKVGSGIIPIVSGVYVNAKEKMARALVLGLKLLYVDRADFATQFGFDIMDIFKNKIEHLVSQGLLELTDDYLKVTFPKGWYYMENISKEFYTEDSYHLPQPTARSKSLLDIMKKK